MAFGDQDAQGRADGGVGWRLLHRVPNLRGRRVTAGIDDVENFLFPATELWLGADHSTSDVQTLPELMCKNQHHV
jgi:hypothetical protein